MTQAVHDFCVPWSLISACDSASKWDNGLEEQTTEEAGEASRKPSSDLFRSDLIEEERGMKNRSSSHDGSNEHTGKAGDNGWLQLGLSNTWSERSNSWEDEVEEEQHERQLTLQLLPEPIPAQSSNHRLGSMGTSRSMHFPVEVAASNTICPKGLPPSKQAEAYNLYEQNFNPAQDVATSAQTVINSFNYRPTTQQPCYDPFSYSNNVRPASANYLVANPALESNSRIFSMAMKRAQCDHEHEQQVLLASNSSRPHSAFLAPPFLYNNSQISRSTTPPQIQSFQHSDPEHSSSFSCERLKVVKASRSGRTGIWFMLEATANLDEIYTLPQIQKNYLHVKDGKVRVSVVKKYVAVKLGLENESEVEMRCRGRVVDIEEEDMSLQEIRDEVWFCDEEANLSSRRRAASTMVGALSSSSSSSLKCTQHHIMLLTYNRRKFCCSSPLLGHDKT